MCMRYIKVYWKYTITKPRLKESTFGRGSNSGCPEVCEISGKGKKEDF